MSKAPYKRLHTNEEYQQKIHEYFGMIGDDYDKPIDMIYIIKNPSASNNSNDDIEEEYEEPEKTFTSMNFVWKIIWEIPPDMFKFMTRPEKIRFIRVAKQRILKTLNTNIDFVSKDLGAKDKASKELAAMQRASLNDEEFKKILSKKIDNLIATSEPKIKNKELYEDNDSLLQTYIDGPKSLPTPKGKKVTKSVAKKVDADPVQVQPVIVAKPVKVAKPPPKPRVAKPKVKVLPQVEPVPIVEPVNKLSEYKKNSIAEFQIEMDDLDEADKLKHKEEDTPEILNGIDTLKHEFLNKFTSELNMIFEEYYDEDVSKLMTTQLQFYAERLQDIRKGVHFKPNRRVQTRVKLRREGILKAPFKPNTTAKILKIGELPKPLGTRVNNQPKVNDLPKVNKKTAQPKPRARAKTLKVNAKSNALPVVKTNAKPNALPVAKTNAETNIEKYAKSVSAMFKTLNMSKLEKLAKKPTPRGVRKTAKMNTPVAILNKPPINVPKITELIKQMYQPKPRGTRSKTKTNSQRVNTLGVNTRAGPVKATKKITPKYLKVQP
jgi:hypothetical protein